jgi:hypothetical protein
MFAALDAVFEIIWVVAYKLALQARLDRVVGLQVTMGGSILVICMIRDLSRQP